MRTNIELDDSLIAEAMSILGLKTQKAAVEKALREFVRIHHQRQAIEALSGIGWEGDLEAMRLGEADHSQK
jgi:Arc/MetJ family transcription regulator